MGYHVSLANFSGTVLTIRYHIITGLEHGMRLNLDSVRNCPGKATIFWLGFGRNGGYVGDVADGVRGF